MRVVRLVLVIALVGAIFVSAGAAMKIQKGYSSEERAYKEVAPYRPIATDAAEAEPTPHKNQGVLDLQAGYPDAVGWVTIPHTGVDYPFVQAEDNEYYLHRDIDGNYAVAGTLFMDCTSDPDLTDFNTIIYGHHMKNGSMFGSLAQFNDEEFFNTNKTGTVFLAERTYTVEFFAYLIVKSDDLTAYDNPVDTADRMNYIAYIFENSRYWRDCEVGTENQIITLSTCAYEFKNARMILVGKLVQTQGLPVI